MRSAIKYLQRSIRSDFPPTELLPNVTIENLMQGAFVVRDQPFNIATKDNYSSSPYQSGIYTYRVTLCFPDWKKRDWQNIIVVKPIEGDKQKPWAHESKTRNISLAQTCTGFTYCSLKIPSELSEGILNHTVIYGGRSLVSNVLSRVWIGDDVPDHIFHFLECEYGRRRSKEF